MVEQAAQYALILESLAEINARLRVLGEAYTRLEAAAERQVELLEALVLRPILPDTQHCSSGNGSQAEHSTLSLAEDANRFIDGGTEYARVTHSALFKVIDLLAQDEQARHLSVRRLAERTGVSKSWCAVAKRHILKEEPVQ